MTLLFRHLIFSFICISLLAINTSCSKSMTGNSDTTKTFYSAEHGISLTYDISTWEELNTPSSIKLDDPFTTPLLCLYTGSFINPTELLYITTPANIEIPNSGTSIEERIFNNSSFTCITTDTPNHQRTYYTIFNSKTYVILYFNYTSADFSRGDSIIENIDLF